MDIRAATFDDVDRATETIALAFATDPVWGVALAGADGSDTHHLPYWRLFVGSAQRQGGLHLLDGGAAVSVWIPPGGLELDDDGLFALEALAQRALGPAGARELEELFERFDVNHPHHARHAYLSLLATHPDHRGRGIGQSLLAANLAEWDAAGVPTYRESTNPANDHRYERVGFRRFGGFHAVRENAPITTMWREVGGPAGNA